MKERNKSVEGLEDLLSFHRFVKSSSKKNDQSFSSRKKQIENEILEHAFNSFSQDCDSNFEMGAKRGKKVWQRTMDAAGEIVSSSKDAHFLDMQLQLSKLDKASVMRISCSSRHAIVITNTGSAYSWGENNYGQLGYESSTKSGKSVIFEQKPRKIEALSKEFIVDAACGEHHSLVLTNQKEVYCFGSNKQN